MIRTLLTARLAAAAGLFALAACATPVSVEPVDIAASCGDLGDNPEGETVVVMRDGSTQTSGGAVAVTAGGDLKAGAALVGAGVATSRGGATYVHRSRTRVGMTACPRRADVPSADETR